MRNKISICTIIALCAMSAYADPIAINTQPIPASVALLVESLFIALGAKFKGVKPVRTFIFWCVITHLTYFVAKWIMEITPDSYVITTLILLELVIVLIETLVLRFWIKNQTGKTTLLYPFVLSFAGNLISLVLGTICFTTSINGVSTWEMIKTTALGFTPRVSLALFAEALVISSLLIKWKFDFIRTLYTWTLISLISFWVFVISYFMLRDFADLLNLYGRAYTISLEIIFACIEAIVIFKLSRCRFYRSQKRTFKKSTALLVSFAGNLTSSLICHAWIFYK